MVDITARWNSTPGEIMKINVQNSKLRNSYGYSEINKDKFIRARDLKVGPKYFFNIFQFIEKMIRIYLIS